MAIWCDVIMDVSLGTGTAKTKLSGDLSGNSADYTLPSSARGILYIQPMLYVTTPTANQTTVASLKLESDDLGMKDYEVLAPPIGNNVATTDASLSDLMRTSIYPVFTPTQGGEKISVFGIPQTANAAAPNMGAMIWLTNDPRQLMREPVPFRARIGGTAGAGASGTSTGTATGSVTGATVNISGQENRVIRSVMGILAATTGAAAKPIAGYFSWNAPELLFTARAQAEPSQGVLGTAQQYAHLTRVDNLSLPCAVPSNIVQSVYLTAAPSTAGNFYQGILYN